MWNNNKKAGNVGQLGEPQVLGVGPRALISCREFLLTLACNQDSSIKSFLEPRNSVQLLNWTKRKEAALLFDSVHVLSLFERGFTSLSVCSDGVSILFLLRLSTDLNNQPNIISC